MRILIDINHPAHVHYFRNFYAIMEEKGHEVYFVSRDKEMSHLLLDLYGIKYINRGKGNSGKWGKFWYLLYANFKLFKLARIYKPDLFLNFLHPYPSQVAKLLGKTSLVFSDTEHAGLHHKLTLPFATKVYTPSCYRIDLGKKQIRFDSFMELAYLHPNYFSPNKDVLKMMGLEDNERFALIRFVSWEATHDFGHKGMTLENKRKAVESIATFAKVFITSEKELPEDLDKYRIQIPFDRMHDAIYFSSLLFGESATMASEAAVLGTPSIFMDNDGRGYTDEEEKRFGLVYNFSESEVDQLNAIEKAKEILSDPNSKNKYKENRENLLANCIDTTQFMVKEVLKYQNPIRN